jgi:putative transposase
MYGQGFVGLIPKLCRQGNRLPRLGQSVAHLLEHSITDHDETLNQRSKSAVYLVFEREARAKGLPVPRYKPFLNRIANRDRRAQTCKRQGPKASAQHDPWVWE